MNGLKLTATLFFVIILLTGCNNDNSTDNFQEPTSGQNYNTSPRDSNHDVRQVLDTVKESEAEIDNMEMEIRDIWQNSKVVIDKLGDLKDKVVADIGAGPYGYFTFRIANNSEIEKIIAIDIDEEALKNIDLYKIILDEDVRNRIETRLVQPHDPQLAPEEADIALIVNTFVYLENPIDYLKNLKKGISKDGKIVIIDFKKRNTPVGPPLTYRAAIGKVELDLMKAGYVDIDSDDQTLDFQYIITARPGLDQN